MCVWATVFPLIVTCAHEHTRTQINTQSNTHSITDCYWQMSHSGPIETRGDGVIVVTLVYWYLPIHLSARVSVFREMNREMEVWPLADCLNSSTPPMQSLFHSTSLFFNCLPSPLSPVLFIFFPPPCFHPPSPSLPPLISSSLLLTGFLYLASLWRGNAALLEPKCETQCRGFPRHFEIVNK